MRAAGVELIEHVGQLGGDGLHRGLSARLPKHWASAARAAAPDPERQRVPLVVLIDYPTFNMHVAAAATAAGVPVLYYITPQVWAWRAGRLERLAHTVTKAPP